MNFLEYIQRWWKEAPPLGRAGVLVGLMAIVLSVAYYVHDASTQRAIPLFVGMSATDASSLAQELDERKVPYELQDNGTTVAVRLPAEEMRKLRLELTSAGLPSGPVTGFEIFDDSSVTLTEFERKVMYQRALQGELARTIAELPQVESARVHLALPTKSLLERNVDPPSASVYVSLKKGRGLDQRIGAGIANLVASSVPGLIVDRIGVMDGNGNMIVDPEDGTGGGKKILALKEERERSLEKDIVDLLERTVGDGHVIAKVAVDMDMTRVEETLEQYDPDNAALRSERKTTEETNSERSQPSAVAGIQGNLPQTPPQAGTNGPGSRTNSSIETDSREFAVPRTVRQVSKPLGEVRRLSIAVLVDTNPFQAPPAADPESEEEGVEVPAGVESPGGTAALPQPSAEVLGALVKNAVGFDETRGDRVEISFVPFVKPNTVTGDEIQYVESPIEPWLWLLLTFLLGVALVAGSMWATERRRKKNAIEDYARQLEEKELLIQQQQSAEDEDSVPNSQRLRQEVREITSKNVAATVEVMKSWLRPTLGRN